MLRSSPAVRGVKYLAQALPEKHWHRFIVHEGTKGPIAGEVAAVRVVMDDGTLPFYTLEGVQSDVSRKRTSMLCSREGSRKRRVRRKPRERKSRGGRNHHSK